MPLTKNQDVSNNNNPVYLEHSKKGYAFESLLLADKEKDKKENDPFEVPADKDESESKVSLKKKARKLLVVKEGKGE